MNYVFCSECGTKLAITRKAMPAFSTIIDIIPPHICSSEPVELDLKPNPAPTFTNADGKFVQKLHKLQPLLIHRAEPGDRRPKDQTKQTSAAPTSIRDLVKHSRPVEAEKTFDPDEGVDND